MIVLTCAAVRKRLAAFHDDELGVQDAVGVQSHIHTCERCRCELGKFEAVSAALRAMSAPTAWFSWPPPTRAFNRAATRCPASPASIPRPPSRSAATLVVGTVVLGMLQFASPERDDSLRALLATVSAVPGSDLNPAGIDGLAVQAPSVPEDGLINASLERSGQGAEQMLAFAAIVHRDGNIAAMQALGDSRGSRQVAALISEITRGRLEPARYGADPMAVSMVWVVEHVTVKPVAVRSRVVGS